MPETKQIDDLLRDFQANKIHIAIVVDEFGGTLGIVTLEDVIEEIVGEINDEYDEVERPYVKVNSNTYLFEAKTMLTDFYKALDLEDGLLDEVSGDADSLAGLLLELKGDFPELHESIDYEHLTFEVMEMATKPLTLILPGATGLAANLIPEEKTLGVRVPDHEFCQKLLRKFGKPIVSTSANISGEKTPKKIAEVTKEILEGVDFVVNPRFQGRPTGQPSSIIAFGEGSEVNIIRP